MFSFQILSSKHKNSQFRGYAFWSGIRMYLTKSNSLAFSPKINLLFEGLQLYVLPMNWTSRPSSLPVLTKTRSSSLLVTLFCCCGDYLFKFILFPFETLRVFHITTEIVTDLRHFYDQFWLPFCASLSTRLETSLTWYWYTVNN